MRVVMRRWLLLAAVVAASLAGAEPLRAQSRADSAAVLLHAAEQLRARGEAGAARALLDLIERQFAGTPAAGQVGQLRLGMRRMPDAERSGRTELILWGTTYGAWLGVAVPVMMDADGPEAYGVGLLAGAPLGFLAGRAWANNRQPTVGQARAVTFGGSWGTYQGFAWSSVLGMSDDGDGRGTVGMGILGGLLGIGAGAGLAQKPITAGTAAAVSSSAVWGSWFGLALSVIAGIEDDALLTSTLIAGNAALIASASAAPRWQMSEGRVRLINVGGLIGVLAGAGVLLIAQPDDAAAAISIPMVGSAVGLTLGLVTTRHRDEPLPEDPGGGRGALLNVTGRRWALDLPEPSLRLQRTEAGTRPAAYVPLLQARF